jgi:hypothetical protein
MIFSKRPRRHTGGFFLSLGPWGVERELLLKGVYEPYKKVDSENDNIRIGYLKKTIKTSSGEVELEEDTGLLRLIRASFAASHGIYGAPRVFLDLREAGETCSKHRVARLMRINKIRAVRGYIHSDLARMALSRGGHGPILPQDCWVVDEADDGPRACPRCRDNGRAAAVPPTHAHSFRPRLAVWKRRLEALLSNEPSGTQHESAGKLLGQCGGRIFLQQSEERAHQKTDL